MSDNKQNTGKQDDLQVNGNDPSEVEYLQSKFPDKTPQQILDAIRTQGPLREDIEAFLART